LQMDKFPRDEFWQQVWPHYNSLCAFTRQLLPAQADDLLQDSLLVALNNWPKLRNPKSFRSWLFRITINEAHRIRRQSFWKRFRSLEEIVDKGEAYSTDSPGTSSQDERLLRMHLKTALSNMSFQQRQVLLLYYLGGFSLKEIALIKDESLSAVKSRISRARRELRELLQGKINLSEISYQREEELDHEIEKTIDGAAAVQRSR
jgi:RNA polymerase sigma factor (sigma-70 family)